MCSGLSPTIGEGNLPVINIEESQSSTLMPAALTIGGKPISPNSASEYVIGSQTLIPAVVPNSIHNLCLGWRYVYTHTASQIYIFRTHSLDATHSLDSLSSILMGKGP